MDKISLGGIANVDYPTLSRIRETIQTPGWADIGNWLQSAWEDLATQNMASGQDQRVRDERVGEGRMIEALSELTQSVPQIHDEMTKSQNSA